MPLCKYGGAYAHAKFVYQHKCVLKCPDEVSFPTPAIYSPTWVPIQILLYISLNNARSIYVKDWSGTLT